MRARSRRARLLTVAVVLTLLGAVAMIAGGYARLGAPPGIPPVASPDIPPGPPGAPPAGSGSCVAPPGARQQDVDPDDSPEAAWPHTPGQRVVVYFETRRLTPRYAGFLRTAAGVWSRSPCIDARAVESCPANGNCSTVALKEESPDADTDGESSGKDKGGVRRGNKMIFYTGLLDKASDKGALATIVHEMGHAIGLVHRLNKNDLMNADTDDNTNPTPDAVDYANLLVIYGGGAKGA